MVVEKVIIVSVHVLYFSFFSFCSLFRFFSSFSLGQSGYVNLCWRDGTWSSTMRQGKDREKTRQDRDKTWTRHGQDTDKTGTMGTKQAQDGAFKG